MFFVRGVTIAVAQRRALAKRVSSGAALPRWYFPVSSRLASGRRQQAEIVFLCRRQQVLFDVAQHQAVFVLARHEAAHIHRPRGELGLGDTPGGKFELPM